MVSVVTGLTVRGAWGHGQARREWQKLKSKKDGVGVMMLAYRLVRLIETHSDALATSLLQRVQTSEFTRDYRKVPAEDLKQTVYEIYRHLGEWLMGKSEFDIELRYRDVGARRAEQGVPLSQLVWVIVLTKENLWNFLKREAAIERPTEVFGELEMLQLLDQFFDRAILYGSIGYENALAARTMAQPVASEHRA